MIRFYSSPDVPAVPGYRIVPTADGILITLSTHNEGWVRELLREQCLKQGASAHRAAETALECDAVVLPFRRAAND